MTPDTIHLIQRNFGEVSNDILTSLIGGIVNEPIIFDVKSDLYPLAQTAEGIRMLTGQIDDKTTNHTFEAGIDFAYEPDLGAVQWLPGGARPVDGSVFYVDYRPIGASSPITDINVGSVARTLSEAVAREIATLYEQLNQTYRSGFVNSAEGAALDQVVAILGLKRKTGDFASGLVAFFRDPQVVGDVTIASGTRLTAQNGAVIFETTQQRTLQRGQARMDVPVRASVDHPGETGQVAAGDIDTQLRPLAGIARVSNTEPTVFGAPPETDAELRARARAELYKLGNATLPALDASVRDSFATLTEYWDPNAPIARRTAPGRVALLVESEPERFASLSAQVNNQRAAGIAATIVARYVFVTPRIVAKIAGGLNSDGKAKVAEEIIAAVQAFAEPLTTGDALEGGALLEAIKAVEDLDDAQIVDVQVARADATPTQSETVVDALTEFIVGGAPKEETALRAELNTLLFEVNTGAPTGRRIPDRSLLMNAEGSAPATDQDIEDAAFLVKAEVEGEPGWIVIDMDAADIALQEAGS
ncbi:baseplate J/gp47 family protein [Shimia sp.]|uniref:baseplate J/gp47 family protein n=1 Tax=Shimia sp. TaxID=1954381 RepID=UPI003BA959D4